MEFVVAEGREINLCGYCGSLVRSLKNWSYSWAVISFVCETESPVEHTLESELVIKATLSFV